MADLSHVAPRSEPSSARTNGSVATTSKTRDSCCACAESKVRCHKERPSCTRCKQRGITCKYLATKRPGRKSNGNSDAGNVRQSREAARSAWPHAADFLPTTLPILSSVSAANDPTLPSTDLFPALLTAVDLSPSSALAGTGSDLDQFNASPMHFLDIDELDATYFPWEGSDMENLPISKDIQVDPVFGTTSLAHLVASKPCSPSSSGWSLSTINSSSTSEPDPSSSCLTRALHLMGRFSSRESSQSNTRDHPMSAGHPSHSDLLGAQDVVAENKRTTEALSTMLQCSCAEDAYLLTMLSMIIFKLLSRYASVVPKQPGSAKGDVNNRSGKTSSFGKETHPDYLGNRHHFNDTDTKRFVTQSILSELHRVQRLVNQLSPKLKAHGPAAADAKRGVSELENSRNACSKAVLWTESEIAMAAFSATTFEQIEKDLRRCLRTLSSEIISILGRM